MQQSAGTLDLYSTQIRASAFEGESVSVTGGLAGPHGLGHAGRAHRAGQRGLRPAAAQRRELHGRVHDGRGRLGRHFLRSAHSHRHRRRSRADVHRRRVWQLAEHHRGGQRGSTLTINNTANAGNFTTVGDSTGPLDCESLDCTFTATSGGVSTGSVVCGDVTSSGTVSAPQLFASNTLIVTNTSDFSDDLFLTKNWAGWSKLQISNNSAASDSGPELRLLGNQSARVFLERRRDAPAPAHLAQTKSLLTQLSLTTTNQRNPAKRPA